MNRSTLLFGRHKQPCMAYCTPDTRFRTTSTTTICLLTYNYLSSTTRVSFFVRSSSSELSNFECRLLTVPERLLQTFFLTCHIPLEAPSVKMPVKQKHGGEYLL